ncbi:helix-turn-helix transcriptional regulator [Erwinia oleae]|uniref:helix-turn-helix transcriptional regulator n=1 Tax=Erwinia oleae TaxID=796334 RepID=UPI000554BB7C|nr:helix-turn-helix domain-containing protein [Erwinia oleae]
MKTAIFEYEALHATAWHQHESGQFYWLSRGIIIIETALAQWAVTPGSVGWFPAGLRHRAWVPTHVSGKSLYLNPLSRIPFPSQPAIYGMDAFFLAVLERLFTNAPAPSTVEYQNTLLTVLRHETEHLAELPLQLILPVDRRARSVANTLMKNPDCMLDQAQLAQQAGLSVRSLSRLFRQQTGLSFSQWRQQAKVVVSLQWLYAGIPVGEVASLSGYSNVSAYIEVFRQRFGKTPGQFMNGKSPAEQAKIRKHNNEI